jgi:hypothetical protein
LAQWEESVTRHDGVTTSAGGEAAPMREKRGDLSWADTNLTGSKNVENPRGLFSWYTWTTKI